MRKDDLPQYWQLVFFPDPGHRHSPEDYINDIQHKGKRALIFRKLETLEMIRLPNQFPNVKPINHGGETFKQLSIGSHRLYICVHAVPGGIGKIVVFFVCKKSSREAKQSDLDQAVRNYRRYLNSIN